MKVLITGSAGFIGFHLAKKMLGNGHVVVGIDNINDYYDTELKYGRLSELGISGEAAEWGRTVRSSVYPGYTFNRMNIEETAAVDRLFAEEGFDKVCHLAAQAGVRYSIENPRAYINSNIDGFFSILESCRHYGTGHLVFASSSSVYGNSAEMPLRTSDITDSPVSLYAATKKSNELMAHAYSHLYNLRTTGLRFFTVYGPWGRPDMAYFLYTQAILEGRPVRVFNYGNMERDFTYIDDIIEGVSRILEQPRSVKAGQAAISSPHGTPFKIYNIGNSAPVLLSSFIEAIEDKLGRKAVREYLPMQPGDVLRTEADVSDLERDFGYRPTTTIQDGIGRFVDWFKSRYGVTG